MEREMREVIELLNRLQIPNATPENIFNPSFDFVSSLYSGILSHIDLDGGDARQPVFSALEILGDPDHHRDSIPIANLYSKMKKIFSDSILPGFSLKDILKPDANRTFAFIRALLDFLIYREEKLKLIAPSIREIQEGFRQEELETKRSQLTRELLELEVTRQQEEPIVQQLDAEVKELQQTVNALNKQQMALKTSFRNLKDKTNEINDKISNADFQLVKNSQENSNLRSKIVQSPDKLQSVLEEKRSSLAQLKNSERSALQTFQERNATIEVYSKAHKKLSKSLSLMKDIQEQVNSAKNIEKTLKVSKAKLRDDDLTEMALEAKRVELEEKVKQAEKFTKTIETERELKHAEAVKELSNVKSEIKLRLHELENRQKKAEATLLEAHNADLETTAIRDSGEATLRKLDNKCEELVTEFASYSTSVNAFLQKF